jgi:hypothetical protein
MNARLGSGPFGGSGQSGAFGTGGQQDFGRMAAFNGNGGNFVQNPGQNSLSGLPAFNAFGGDENNQQFFADQQDFNEMDNQYNFNAGFPDASFSAGSSFGLGAQNQSLPNPGPGMANGAPQQLFGQPPNARQRWQSAPQRDQNQ